MTPDDFRETCRRKEKICVRLSRASFRLEMAELERLWAIMSAHSEGMSVREIAKQVGLGPTRVHQLISNPGFYARNREIFKTGKSSRKRSFLIRSIENGYQIKY
jgi:hypothetical protein